MLHGALLALALIAGSGSPTSELVPLTPPSRLLLILGDGQNTGVGQELARPIAYRILSDAGHGVQGIALKVSVSDDAKVVSETADLVSDRNGQVFVRVRAGGAARRYGIRASFTGLAAPVVAHFDALELSRANPAPFNGPLLAADLLDSGGRGVMLAAADARWHAYGGPAAGALEEKPFPDDGTALATGWSARSEDGVAELVYGQRKADTDALRYVTLREGTFSAPLVLPIAPADVVDAALVAGGEPDLVYVRPGQQVHVLHLGSTPADRAVSRTGEIAAWPSGVRVNGRLIVGYVTLSLGGSNASPSPSASPRAAGSSAGVRSQFFVSEESGEPRPIALPSARGARLVINGTRLGVLFVDDASLHLKYCEITQDSCAAPLDSGITLPRESTGRAYVAAGALTVVGRSGSLLVASTLSSSGAFGPVRTLLDLRLYPVDTVLMLANGLGSDGKLWLLLDLPNALEGRNAYLLNVDVGSPR